MNRPAMAAGRTGVLTLAIIFLLPVAIAGQDGRTETPGGAGDRDLSLENENPASSSPSFTKRFSLRTGGLLAPQIPMGELGDSMSMGMASLRAFGDIQLSDSLTRLPLKRYNLDLRTGLWTGFTALSSNGTTVNEGSASLISFMPYGQVSYRLRQPFGTFSPYFQMAFGFTLNSVSVTSPSGSEVASDSSFDGSMQFALGTGFETPSVKNVVFLFELSYFSAFETVSGNFLGISLGAAYLW